jgi:hypothetical protein
MALKSSITRRCSQYTYTTLQARTRATLIIAATFSTVVWTLQGSVEVLFLSRSWEKPVRLNKGLRKLAVLTEETLRNPLMKQTSIAWKSINPQTRWNLAVRLTGRIDWTKKQMAPVPQPRTYRWYNSTNNTGIIDLRELGETAKLKF